MRSASELKAGANELRVPVHRKETTSLMSTQFRLKSNDFCCPQTLWISQNRSILPFPLQHLHLVITRQWVVAGVCTRACMVFDLLWDRLEQQSRRHRSRWTRTWEWKIEGSCLTLIHAIHLCRSATVLTPKLSSFSIIHLISLEERCCSTTESICLVSTESHHLWFSNQNYHARLSLLSLQMLIRTFTP